MNDKLHTYIEPELEARITALVLGEASEFEVDELERLIEEKPELAIFRRRIQVMHDLLGDAIKPLKDAKWQLSKVRRDELKRTFSKAGQSVVAKKTPKSRRTRNPKNQIRASVVIAACVMLCFILFMMATPVYKRGESEVFSPDIVSYMASEEDDAHTDKQGNGRLIELRTSLPKEEIEGSPSPIVLPEVTPGANMPGKKSVADNKQGGPILGGIPATGRLFKDKSKSKGEGKVAKREMTRSVERKPSSPSSSMAKVIASNTISPATVPVPKVDVPDPSTDFGNGDDFGDGWGGGSGGGGRISGGASSGEDDADPFAAPGEDTTLAKNEVKKSPPSLDTMSRSRSIKVSGGVVSDGVIRGELPQEPIRQLDDLAFRVDTNSDKLASKEGETHFKLSDRKKELEGQVENMRKVVNGQADEGLDKARSMQELNVARKEYEMARSIRDGLEAKYDLERAKATTRGEKPPAKVVLERSTTTIPSPVTPKALPDETTTSATPFSTFSLNVADVSFKLAKVALLEKGQWPNAAKVRTEEFVNAFDYGDPSPRRGEPVACAIEQSAHPFLQQRNLLRVGMKTASIGRSAPLRLTVLLDNSGSMEREDREASVLAAIEVLASQLGPQDVITVVGFARQPRLLADRMRGDQAHKLVEIVANTPSEGGTNIEEALRLARALAKRQHTEGAQDRVVLITDGVANLGNTIPEELSKQIVAMRQEGIAFDACGVGAGGLNDDILEALTRKGDGRYYFLNRAEDADSGFAKQLAGALTPAAKNVKVQVKFNPKRVSRYRLLGFEKHRLKKEDFRNDKVDAAEMAAEEAGNAVYQIQVNPQGVGELGEVFVRFLDASTGRMVERSWPLPYDPKAPSFDLAAPSMQLAGTAAMLGEKLHGTDAGSVRFSMISNTLNKLRGHYEADRKVQDLIRMCRKVK